MKNMDTVRLLHLHAKDNISVLSSDGKQNQTAETDTIQVSLPCDLTMGHKVAIAPIPCGSEVLKYGAPIGVASCDIAVGDHVHLHNLQSRYTVIEDMEGGQK